MNVVFLTQKYTDKNNIQSFIPSIYNFLKSHLDIKIILNDKNFDNTKDKNFFFLGSRSKRFSFIYNIVKILKLYYVIFSYNKKQKINTIYIHQLGIFIPFIFPLKFILDFQIYFWRAHTHHSFFTNLYYFCSDKIFTTNKKTINNKFFKKKINYIGHMIDTSLFKFSILNKNSNKFIYIGRITKVKKIDKMIKFIHYHNKKNYSKIYLDLFGPIGYVDEDISYYNDLKNLINRLNLYDFVNFKGAIKRSSFNDILPDYFGYFNFSIGAIDKSVLESALCGLIIFSNNEAYNYEFKNFSETFFQNFEDLSKRILYFKKMDNFALNNYLNSLCNEIKSFHSLENNFKKTFNLN